MKSQRNDIEKNKVIEEGKKKQLIRLLNKIRELIAICENIRFFFFF